MPDLLLITALGFLGSFGHCAGMCGPLTLAFSLSADSHNRNPDRTPDRIPQWLKQFWFHGLLNLGRLLSYTLIGAGIGAISSVLVAGGQLAGIDSQVRRGIAIVTGIMLILFGLSQVGIRIPIFKRLTNHKLHDRINHVMVSLALRQRWWTPVLLGIAWGWMPCGFLYAAQIKAAEAGNAWLGGATMLAFGLGTLPVMLGVGISAALVSADRRSQLYRMGGWLSIAIGSITILRNGDMMTDYTGHASLLFLILALIARPLSKFWSVPLQYRRVLGVGAFILAITHTAHMLEHTLQWQFEALFFMLPLHQTSMWMGLAALLGMAPAALTSTDRSIEALGKRWRQIHLLAVPALLLAVLHAILIGSSYLGKLTWTDEAKLRTVSIALITIFVFLIRLPYLWSALSLQKLYTPHTSLKSDI